MATPEADTSDERYSEGMYTMSLSPLCRSTQPDCIAHARSQSQMHVLANYNMQ